MKKICKKIICLAVIASMSVVSALSVNAGYEVAFSTPKNFYTGYGTATGDVSVWAYPERGNAKALTLYTTVRLKVVPKIVNTGVVVDYYSGAKIGSSSGSATNCTNVISFVDFNKTGGKITGFGSHEVRGYSAWVVYTAIYGVSL